MDSEVSELVSGPVPALPNCIPASAASISPTVKWLYVPLRGLTKTEFVRPECWAKARHHRVCLELLGHGFLPWRKVFTHKYGNLSHTGFVGDGTKGEMPPERVGASLRRLRNVGVLGSCWSHRAPTSQSSKQGTGRTPDSRWKTIQKRTETDKLLWRSGCSGEQHGAITGDNGTSVPHEFTARN